MCWDLGLWPRYYLRHTQELPPHACTMSVKEWKLYVMSVSPVCEVWKCERCGKPIGNVNAARAPPSHPYPPCPLSDAVLSVPSFRHRRDTTKLMNGDLMTPFHQQKPSEITPAQWHPCSAKIAARDITRKISEQRRGRDPILVCNPFLQNASLKSRNLAKSEGKTWLRKNY